MSYYAGNYWKNPVPYTSSDIGEPVPGWGVNPAVAGPTRVGVGAVVGATMAATSSTSPFAAKKILRRKMVLTEGGGVDDGAGEEFADKITPFWVWPAVAAVVLGGIGYVGTKQGWL